VLFNLSKDVNSLLNTDEKISKGVLSEINSFYLVYGGDVLGIVPKEQIRASLSIELPSLGLNVGGTTELTSDLIEALIEVRNELRDSKQWELADKVRDRLSELGIIIEDKKDKVAWRKKK
jgi:cysteinyl-tRNA synthetase